MMTNYTQRRNDPANPYRFNHPVRATLIGFALTLFVAGVIQPQQLHGNPGNGGGGIIELLILLALYFLPAIVAKLRHHRQRTSILIINIFLGWTLLGWVAALAMACSATRNP